MSRGLAAVCGLREPHGRVRAVVVKDLALGTLASFNDTGLRHMSRAQQKAAARTISAPGVAPHVALLRVQN